MQACTGRTHSISHEVKPMRPILLIALLFGWTAALAGQIPEGVEGTYVPHPEAEKAISQIMSPFCPGLMLSQCPAAESVALRDSIHALAVQGWTSGEITAWVLANHGEEYKAVPDRSGSGLWAWIVPPISLLLGLVLVVEALRRFRRDGTEDDGIEPGPEPSPEEEARLREALRELELSEDPSY